MSADIVERLSFMQLEPRRAIILGTAGDRLIGYLEQHGCAVETPDLATIDPEQPLCDGPYDLVLSLGMLDTVNDLPGALFHLRNALVDDGLVIASFIGAGSLPVLREVMLAADGDRPAARMHPMIDRRAAAQLMQRAGFARQVVDSHALRLRYGDLRRLIADLREQGLGNALADRAPSVSKAGLKRAMAAFAKLANTDGKVTESMEVLTITGWKS